MTRRRITTAAWTLCAVLAAAFAIVTVAGGIHYSRIVSDSMQPGIHRGDLIITRAIPLSDLKVGDIPVLADGDGGASVAHRVLRLTTSPTGTVVVTTKGDANRVADLTDHLLTSPKVPVVTAVVPLSVVPLSNIDQRWASLTFLLLIVLVIATLAWSFIGSRRGPVADTVNPWDPPPMTASGVPLSPSHESSITR